MKISLDTLEWQLKGYWPYVPIKETSMETGQTLSGVTDWIPATVPGGVHYDLWRAGLMENPYVAQQSLHAEWVEHRWWMYRTMIPESILGGKAELKKIQSQGRRIFLVFDGLDYEAEVFFNDLNMGTHVGMYDRFELDITDRIQAENTLLVLFRGIPEEMGQIGYTSQTFTQKSRFNYKWDFSTRIVNIGFWKGVNLYVTEPVEEKELHWFTSVRDNVGIIQTGGVLQCSEEVRKSWKEEPQLVVSISEPAFYTEKDCPGKNKEWSVLSAGPAFFEKSGEDDLYQASLQREFQVENPKLWNPVGYGKPWLYQLRFELKAGSDTIWSKTAPVGIRSLAFLQNESAPEGALPYTICLNERKIYIRGVNITPLDHFYGNVTPQRYEYLVQSICEAGCNLVRVWGGGLIETEEFYALCDRYGLLIWQEFIQSSSGIDNIPSVKPEFLRLLQIAARACVMEKRSHVSLTIYGGGNELMLAPNRPVGYDHPNIRLLKQITEELDPGRFFYPTSASGPREFISFEKNVSHDVHGNWRYEGNPQHYQLYGQSDNLFHSEFGTDAAANQSTLRRFLPKKSLHPTPMSQNPDWKHHGEWWGTYFRDCDMFGEIPKTEKYLKHFTACSQYMQSEGLRFILDSDRRKAFHNSGVIIWQMNEPWPNASCTNLMDYFGDKKSAYYQVKRCFAKRRLVMDYETLTYTPGTETEFAVYALNASESWETEACFEVLLPDGTVEQTGTFFVSCKADCSEQIGVIPIRIPAAQVFFIRFSWKQEGEWHSQEPWMLSTQEKQPFAAMSAVSRDTEKVVITDAAAIEDAVYAVTLENRSEQAAIEAGVELSRAGDYVLEAEENYVFLLPGEKKTLNITLKKRADVLFETDWNTDDREKSGDEIELAEGVWVMARSL